MGLANEGCVSHSAFQTDSPSPSNITYTGKRTRKPGPKGPKNSNKYVLKERPRGVEKREGGRR